MHIIEHQLKLPVSNQDLDERQEQQVKRHGVLFPNSIRALVCGSSGCGKTNAVISLLFEPHGLRFQNVYVYSKSLFQPKYELLKTVLCRVKEIKYFPYDQSVNIIDPLKARENSIFIFDDVACSSQEKIRAYFSMGRHKSVDCFYLCQTYTRIPKHLIRDNANLLILFKQDDINLKHVYDEHVTTDMPFRKFKELCGNCWKTIYGFVVIVKDNALDQGRYRMGFDKYIIIEN